MKVRESIKLKDIYISLSVLVCSGYCATYVGLLPAGIVLAIMIFFLILLHLKKDSVIVFNKVSGGYVVLHAISILGTYIVNIEHESITVTLLLLLIDFGTILIISFYENNMEPFFRAFLYVFFILAFISAIGFVVVNIWRLVDLPIIGTRPAYEFGVFYAKLTYTMRNSGIFYEPGAYAQTIAIVMLFEFFLGGRKINKKIIFYALLTILTVQSTTGYILVAIAFIIMFDIVSAFSPYKKIIFEALIFCLVICGLLFQTDILNMLTEWAPGVFKKIANQSISYTTRMIGPGINLKIFGENMLFGAGLSNSSALFAGYTNGMTRVDTITTEMAAFGVLGTLPTVVLMYGIWQQKRIALISKVLICIFFVFILFSQTNVSCMLIQSLTIFFLSSKSLFIIDEYKLQCVKLDN